MGAVVAMKSPPTLIMEFGPKKKPLALARMTVPLALRLPKICDGLAPPISLSTTEFAEGWMNVVVSPAGMLKLLQLRNAAWLTVKLSCAPLVWAVAVPSRTVMPVGLADSFRQPTAAKNTAARPDHFRLAVARAR